MNPHAPSTGRLFVGRQAEIAALKSALDEAVGGHGGLDVITGEAGIGKSALVDEHLAHAERRGVPVARGRCFEADTAPPYGPWVSALQRLARIGHPPARSQLRRWLAGAQGESDLAREQLFEMIGAHLVEAALQSGLVLVIEDAHWADSSSLLLLSHLVDDLATARVHALVTCRDESPVSSDLARLAGARAISLGGLAEQDVMRYLELRLDPDYAATHHTELKKRTGGNPLYLGELVRLVEAGGNWGSVPQGASQVINRRLATLPTETRRVLELASAIGSEAGVQLLADIAGQSVLEVIEEVDAAVAAKIVTQSQGPPATIRFAHDLIREAVYQQLPPSVLQGHHKAIAEAIERQWAADLGEHLAALAYHWQRAGAAPADVAEWTLRAAGHAVDRLAYDDGVRFYEAALEIPGVAGNTEVLLRLARSHYLAGHIQSSFRTCQKIAELAHSRNDSRLLAEAALVLEGVADPGDPSFGAGLIQMCEEAFEKLGDSEPALRARLLGQLTTQVAYSDFARTADLSATAMPLAEASGDLDALVAALRARQLARSGPYGVHERLEIGARMIQVGSSTRRSQILMWGRLWRIDALLQIGDLAAVDFEQAELQGLVDRLQQPLARWHLLRLQSARAAFEGRFQRALELGEQARNLGHRAGARHGEFQWIAFRIGVAVQLGEPDVLADLMPRARIALPVQRLLNALGLLVMGREAEAQALYEAGVAQLKSHPTDHQWLSAASALAEAAGRLGSESDGRWLYPRLQPFAGQLCSPGAGPPIAIRGAADLWLGILASMVGEPGAAATLEKAIATHDRLGARPYAAVSRLAYARHLVSAERHREAEKPAARALEVASELGMTPLAGEAKRLLDSLPTAAVANPLSRRESEIAEQVSKGLTSKQIASALFLSERTVETHVQNILGKLGFQTRSQIATWVARRSEQH